MNMTVTEMDLGGSELGRREFSIADVAESVDMQDVLKALPCPSLGQASLDGRWAGRPVQRIIIRGIHGKSAIATVLYGPPPVVP